jgi:hypothetical protein
MPITAEPSAQIHKTSTNACSRRSPQSRQTRTDHRLSAFPVQALWTIRLPILPNFRLAAFRPTEAAPRTRLSAPSSRMFTIPAHPRKSMPTIFLNCTKNTELTPRPFARTFCFASPQKMNRNPVGDKTWTHRPLRIGSNDHGRATLQRRVNRPGLMRALAPAAASLRIRASLQRCRQRRHINRAFRRRIP